MPTHLFLYFLQGDLAPVSAQSETVLATVAALRETLKNSALARLVNSTPDLRCVALRSPNLARCRSRRSATVKCEKFAMICDAAIVQSDTLLLLIRMELSKTFFLVGRYCIYYVLIAAVRAPRKRRTETFPLTSRRCRSILPHYPRARARFVPMLVLLGPPSFD